ncbi:hypothetical protein L610_000500001370 [Aminobacter sp. J44]|nr:hypothetical protein L610_000500001370 [Aminobacter sp. J44]
MPKIEHVGLTSDQVQSFIDDGFVKIENAFSVDLAKQCRDELWADIGLSPDEPEKWVHPVVWVGFKASPPFIEAAKTPRLHQAYNQLAGEGRWLAPKGLGTFPIRFPSPEMPGDDGWHVDMSFGTDNPDFMEWRANVKSSGRALLMLFLFSDVGPDDAPTRIRVGSHAHIARELLPYGEAGATLRQLSANGHASTEVVRWNWRQARRAQSISATLFWSMPHSHTGGSGRASWRNRHSCRKASSIAPCRHLRYKWLSARQLG